MKKMTVYVIALDHIQNLILETCRNDDRICPVFLDTFAFKDSEKWAGYLEAILKDAEAILIGNLSQREDIFLFLDKVKNEAGVIPIIPVGGDLLATDYFNVSLEFAVQVNAFFQSGGSKNIATALRMIYQRVQFPDENFSSTPALPEEMPYDGIFHPFSGDIFASLAEYLIWYRRNHPERIERWIGLLTHRHNWLTGNTAVEMALIEAFEKIGFGVIAVFSHASADEKEGIKDFDNIIADYYVDAGKPLIMGLINLQMLAAIGNGGVGDLFAQSVMNFQNIGIPVFRPVVSFFSSQQDWLERWSGLSDEITWAYTLPEMIGMIEPVPVGFRTSSGMAAPYAERLERFVRRAAKWIDLSMADNSQKKIALIIHSAPCYGMEATIGSGAGLDVFASIIDILNRMQAEGYLIQDIPSDAEALHQLLMEKKACQDFRWTSVESIASGGGVLCRMPVIGENGYLSFYNKIDADVREKIEDAWGSPPGIAMVYDGEILITGLTLGNIMVLVQPKRGCYGSKCTGEVCKMLHDPDCSPPHQYIATYRFLEEIAGVHAVIHVGTGGSLEYLPGKVNAVSGKCYPDIVLGNMPNIYLYNAGVGGEGTIAKRRTNAVILDYMPASIRVDRNKIRLINSIVEYEEESSTGKKQAPLLKEALGKMIDELPGASMIVANEKDFHAGISKLKSVLVQSVGKSAEQKLHRYGQMPEMESCISYIRESLFFNNPHIIDLLHGGMDEYGINILLSEIIASTLQGLPLTTMYVDRLGENALQELTMEIIQLYDCLEGIEREMENLLRALDGKYIEPGLSGLPSDGLNSILPTGRNFYLLNAEKIPTREAYFIGQELAEKLLQSYIEDEGQLPEKVAMNMISTDISMSKGEQLAQILYLMGTRPVWNANGKVAGVEVISLDELNRPRIDVTVRISGILRDSYPDAVDLIDQAAVLVASLEDEPLEKNYIRRNSIRLLEMLELAGEKSGLERRSTIRVFGDKPGTYGAGVDLALKASAWKDDADIARIITAFSSFAYGGGLNGMQAPREFVQNIKDSDLSYETTISSRCDIIASGFSASVHGGLGALKRIISGREMKQYHGNSNNGRDIKVATIQKEIRDTLENTFLNPLWRENIMEDGNLGAEELLRRIHSIYDWQVLSENIVDADINKIVEMYVNDTRVQDWLFRHNKYAMEEMARRFLELNQRGKWKADEKILYELKRTYAKIEGDMEDLCQDETGDIQGGNVEIIGQQDVESWSKKLREVNACFDKFLE